MPVHNRIAGLAATLTEWRRDLHAHPELGFEEHRTSAIVAEKLASWGIEVTRNIAGTGVVGTLRDEGTAIASDKAAWHIPPADLLFVQRKISGTALLAAKLKARIDVRGLIRDALTPTRGTERCAV